MDNIKIRYLNNEGEGFAKSMEVPAGTTVGMFFQIKMEGADPANYVIRLNGDTCSPNDRLNEGDKLSLTPRKIQGA